MCARTCVSWPLAFVLGRVAIGKVGVSGGRVC